MEITVEQKEDIYREYQKKIFGYIYTKINNVQDAEDITADVFVKVFEKIDSFDDTKASLTTWIYTIARNTLIDHYRRHKTMVEIPLTLDDGSSVEDDVCNSQQLDQLAKALQSLEERERDIIILRFYHGKQLKEIAQDLNISYAYVKVLQAKAFEKMKDFLDFQ